MSILVEGFYQDITRRIIADGTERKGRNGNTKSLPFQQLTFDLSDGFLPLLTTRQMFYKGILGEYAAMIRGPKHVNDFKKFGCNYWDQWSDEDGNINIDYGNAWIDYNGVNQMEYVLDSLRNNPADRRMVINGWRPDKLSDLSLPCCHHSYQFWSDGKVVDLLWIQRSGDWMVGVPSDMVFASVMLLCFADLAGCRPRNVNMVIGDAHIYEEHIPEATKHSKRLPWFPPTYKLKPQKDLYSFVPEDLEINNYQHNEPIKYLLKD